MACKMHALQQKIINLIGGKICKNDARQEKE